MQLRQALNIQRGDIVAFTGAGGKTSALFRLANELTAEGWRVICTTTTRVAIDELSFSPHTLQITDKSLRPEAISRALSGYGTTFLYTQIVGGKAIGLAPESIEILTDRIDSDVILIEADGARHLPFKAPLSHEPVIPPSTSLVIPMAGFDAVGKPFNADYVYNPEGMNERYGYAFEDKIKGPWLASVLRDEELGLKGVPDHARVIPLINKVPSTGVLKARARMIARLILRQNRIHAAAIGSVQSANPVHTVERRTAAIVLAGGLSSRMGQSKVLLPWDGRPVIRVIVDKLKRMRFDEIIVVTGHMAEQVKAALGQEPVRCVHNTQYREGDMLSSLQAGLKALKPEISAAMIVLGDQPQLENRVVIDVLNAYAEGRGAIIAPSYKKRRGHPILLDRAYWSEILDLPKGAAPRDVINAHPEDIAYVNVASDSILRDMDTPEDYNNERRRAGLI